jgi:hypothetical protein
VVGEKHQQRWKEMRASWQVFMDGLVGVSTTEMIPHGVVGIFHQQP